MRKDGEKKVTKEVTKENGSIRNDMERVQEESEG